MSMYKNFKNPTFKINIQEFKEKLEVIDSKTGKDKYESFTVFKRNVLDPSEKEINENSDINFSYIPIEGVKYGKGRKPIEKLEFTIKKVNQGKMVSYDPNNKDDFPLFNQLINDYKLRKDQAILVLNNFTRKEINAKLFAIMLDVSDKKIRNIGAYTVKVFKLP
jgi:plasmid replication initiation protein